MEKELNCLNCTYSEPTPELKVMCKKHNKIISNFKDYCKDHPGHNDFTCEGCVVPDCQTRNFNWSSCNGKRLPKL